jgi:hypothetical protein
MDENEKIDRRLALEAAVKISRPGDNAQQLIRRAVGFYKFLSGEISGTIAPEPVENG